MPGNVPDWTPDRQGTLVRYLESADGQALLARLRATAYHNFRHINGQNAGELAVMAARAQGYDDAIKHLESLSRVSIRDNKTDEMTLAGQGEPELSERFTP